LTVHGHARWFGPMSDEAAGSPSGDGPALDGANSDLIAGVAKVLQEASAALARLGAGNLLQAIASSGAADSSAASSESKSAVPLNLTSIAAGLAQAAAALSGGGGSGGGRGGGGGGGGHSSTALKLAVPKRSDASRHGREEISDYVSEHGLESWMNDVFEMMAARQRASVMDPPLRLDGARNPTGVVMSRVRNAVPVERRVEMFVRVNDLGEGVVDRLSTLTAEQCEAVMDTGLKIEGARNPSGVAMKRITTVLKNSRDRGGRPINLSARQDRPAYNDDRRQSKPDDRRQSKPERPDRRSTRPPIDGGDALGLFSHDDDDDLPSDVRKMVDEYRLDNWCGEVLRRLSLWQRQKVAQELGKMSGVRNPSGVVMGRVKHVATTDELVAIFVDINSLDKTCESKLWNLTSEQRAAVIAPGIYLQNVRNASTAVNSRIANVLDGRSAMERGALRPGNDRRRDRSPDRRSMDKDDRHGGAGAGAGRRKRPRESSSGSGGGQDSGSGDSDNDSVASRRRRRRRRTR